MEKLKYDVNLCLNQGPPDFNTFKYSAKWPPIIIIYSYSVLLLLNNGLSFTHYRFACLAWKHRPVFDTVAVFLKVFPGVVVWSLSLYSHGWVGKCLEILAA